MFLLGQRSLPHFVGAKVQRADHNGASCHLLDNLTVGLVVIFLTRFHDAGEVQKLGPVQTDTIGTSVRRASSSGSAECCAFIISTLPCRLA